MITFNMRRDRKVSFHRTRNACRLPSSKLSCELPLLPYISPINLSAVHEARYSVAKYSCAPVASSRCPFS